MEPANFSTKLLYAEAMRHVAETVGIRFDFMQIDPTVAEVFRRGEKSQHRDAGLTLSNSVFAGDIVALPSTLAWFPNPAVRLLARYDLFPLLRMNRRPT